MMMVSELRAELAGYFVHPIRHAEDLLPNYEKMINARTV
jgi:hypothetical protein